MKLSRLYHTFRQMHLAIACACVLSACAAKTNDEGHIGVAQAASQLTAGSSYKQDVVKLLGTPSTKSSFGDETWYYISAHKESYAFLKPTTTTQDTLSITFDTNGMVTNVTHHGLQDAQDVAIAKRITPTEGQKLGLWEQMIGNLGKFNKTTEAR